MVSLVMNGRRMPSLALASRMAKHYGMTLDELHRKLAAQWPADVRKGTSRLVHQPKQAQQAAA